MPASANQIAGTGAGVGTIVGVVFGEEAGQAVTDLSAGASQVVGSLQDTPAPSSQSGIPDGPGDSQVESGGEKVDQGASPGASLAVVGLIVVGGVLLFMSGILK